MTKRVYSMKTILSSFALTLGLVAGVSTAFAAEEGGIPTAGNNIRDQASLQRGAKLFFNYCVGCHSLKYVR